MASHLLKWTHYIQDTEERDVELRYFRDVDGREVDFVLVENRQPLTFIECKSANKQVSKSLRYLVERFPKVDAWQISATGTNDFTSAEGIRVAPAITYLRTLV